MVKTTGTHHWKYNTEIIEVSLQVYTREGAIFGGKREIGRIGLEVFAVLAALAVVGIHKRLPWLPLKLQYDKRYMKNRAIFP